jgi:hypothetical protein
MKDPFRYIDNKLRFEITGIVVCREVWEKTLKEIKELMGMMSNITRQITLTDVKEFEKNE